MLSSAVTHLDELIVSPETFLALKAEKSIHNRTVAVAAAAVAVAVVSSSNVHLTVRVFEMKQIDLQSRCLSTSVQVRK
jgi:phosphoglucomutase